MKEKFNNLFAGKNFMLIISFLGVYMITSGLSWAILTYVIGDSSSSSLTQTENGKKRVDTSLPKTESCPINGKMYTKAEKDIWETRRPITAIIENHLESRPQSGLSKADVVYEAVAEGGITRFLSVFYCGASEEDTKIAPIRSIRVYYIDWASEYGKYPILVHSGGANNICNNCPGGVKTRGDVDSTVDAFKVLTKLGWRAPNGNAMDAGTNLGYPAVKRDQYRLENKSAWEHSFEGYTDEIYKIAEERGFAYEDSQGSAWNDDFVTWKFADEKTVTSAKISEITFSFWDNKPDYDVKWKYDSVSNSFLRFTGNKEHLDHNTKTQLAVKNVVIQFVKEKGPVDKEGHMFYTTTGTGEALVFQNGEVIEGTWKKKDQFARTIFYDEQDNEVEFVRGEIWIEAVPVGNEINY